MEKFFLPLFKGIDEEDYKMLVGSGYVRRKNYDKSEFILRAGDRVTELGLICSGMVHIESNDIWGNKSILSEIVPGQIFAETYALCHEPLMVNVLAVCDTSVMFIDLDMLMSRDNESRGWYIKLTHNLLMMSARKNMTLSNRIFCTSSKTVRGRLSTYFSSLITKSGTNEFDIPFDRQGLADYLNVDRSALSKELCRMRDEGLLEFHKNHFKLYIR